MPGEQQPSLGQRRTQTVSDQLQRRARDDRTAAEVRADICRRVDGRYLPRVLARETFVATIHELADSQYIDAIAAELNYRDLRRWVADCCGIDYEPAGDRCYSFRHAELQAIDYVLDEAGLEPDAEIETDDPPLARS